MLLFSSRLYLRCSKLIYTNLENVFSNDYRNTKVRPFLVFVRGWYEGVQWKFGIPKAPRYQTNAIPDDN